MEQEIVMVDRAAVLVEDVAVAPQENVVCTVILGQTVWKNVGLKEGNYLKIGQGQQRKARTLKFFAGTVRTQVTGKESARSSVAVTRPGLEAGKSRKLRE